MATYYYNKLLIENDKVYQSQKELLRSLTLEKKTQSLPSDFDFAIHAGQQV